MKTDEIFASEVADEFGIPLQSLVQLVNTLRSWKQVHPEKINLPSWKRGKYANLIRIMDSPDFRVTDIHLETPGDVIHLSEDDPLFYYFNTSIKRMQNAFKREMVLADKQWSKYINEWAKRQIFRYVISYSKNHNLSVFNQRAIIGLFLIHFEINLRKPIMTPAQWENKMIGDGHNDYLNFIVKYQYKKYLALENMKI